jgi:hypothetical protein
MPSGFVYFFSCSSVLLSRNNSVFCPELGLELRDAQVGQSGAREMTDYGKNGKGRVVEES